MCNRWTSDRHGVVEGLPARCSSTLLGELARRGNQRVALHVDAQSLTGATHMYESVGMHIEELSHEYELEIRRGMDLTTHAPPSLPRATPH